MPHHATGADEDVLRPVGHADHLMRNHLTDRKDQIVAAVPQQLVHLRGPGVVELAFRTLRA